MQVFGTTIGWGEVIVLAMAVVFLLIMAVSHWWSSRRHPYSAREMRSVEEAIREKASRPKPAWADDPIARSIEWTGTNAFGADPSPNPKGAMVRITSASASRIAFQESSARAWYGWMTFFGVVGFVLVVISTGSFVKALLAPLVCAGLSVLVWWARRDSLRFDKGLGMYWRGNTPPTAAAGTTSSHQVGRISDIYALQLIGTRRFIGDPRMGAGSDHKEFLKYELNRVLKYGTRLSMVCCDDYDGLTRDARVLATFLQRPLWTPA
jgi:hypothetical protein